MLRRPLALLLLASVLAFAAGCGGDDDDQSATTTGATTATVPTTATAPNDDATAPAVANAADLTSKPKIARPTGSPPSRLVVKDLVEGKGRAVSSGDTVTVHYVGIAFSNGEQFDSSWDRGEPTAFSTDEVIPGWGQGLVGMKVGGRRELVIPPDLGYGEQGQPSAGILPRETLVFVIDLKAIS